MEWSYKDVRHNAWFTTFHRGWRAWLKLVAVCFIFAFIGATNSSQASFIDGIDQLIGSGTPLQPQGWAGLTSRWGCCWDDFAQMCVCVHTRVCSCTARA